MSGEDWDRNHASEQEFSQAHEQSVTKAVPDSSAKVVGPTSESVPEVQIQESTISRVPNPAPNPVLEPVPEPSPGLPPVKNTYARIIKLPKLLDCCGQQIAEYRALLVLLFFFIYLFCYFQSVIIFFLKRGRWYDTELFCVNCLIYFRGDCQVIFVWACFV